jgi:citrate lyase subunit beta / citryl-CoA lyase
VTPNTYLFVPGNRPERFAKALFSGADRVVVDLEDAVTPSDKAMARASLGAWLATLDKRALEAIVVRINDAKSPWFEADLAWLALQPLGEVMLAKCETPRDISAVLAAMQPESRVLPLLETVRGVMDAARIAATPGVSRLAFGSIDYLLDLDLPGPGLALDHAAIVIAMASRAEELPAPVAGVTPDIDPDPVTADWLHARSLGFGAKLCIHPKQVEWVRKSLKPDDLTVMWARRVVDAWDAHGTSGVVLLEGKMVDKPVLLRAQRILNQAHAAI